MLQRFSDEDGVVAVITALLLVVLIGSAALAIDLGSLRTTRRTTANAADSIALGVANYLLHDAEDDGRCNYATAWQLAQSLLNQADLDGQDFESLTIEYDASGHAEGDLANSPGLQNATNAQCDVVGRVRAEITSDADVFFGAVFGRTGSDVQGQTTSQFGYGPGSARLPAAVCSRDEPVTTAITMVSPGSGFDVWPDRLSDPARINFASQSAMLCGSVAGNLGFIDCEQPSNGNGNAQTFEIVRWIESGCPSVDVNDPPAPAPLPEGSALTVYDDDTYDPVTPVLIEASNVCGENPSVDAWCDVSSRNNTGNQIDQALLSLVGDQRTIIVVDEAHCANQTASYAPCPGPGNANVRPIGILTIEIEQVCTSGNVYSLDVDGSCGSDKADLCEYPNGDLEIALEGTCPAPSTGSNLGNNGFTMFVRFLKYSQDTGSTGRSNGTLTPLQTEMCASENTNSCSYDAP